MHRLRLQHSHRSARGAPRDGRNRPAGGRTPQRDQPRLAPLLRGRRRSCSARPRSLARRGGRHQASLASQPRARRASPRARLRLRGRRLRLMYRWVEHTAELELQIEAASPEALFADALDALAELIRQDGAGESARFAVDLTAADPATLLADWLGELVYLAETQDFV